MKKIFYLVCLCFCFSCTRILDQQEHQVCDNQLIIAGHKTLMTQEQAMNSLKVLFDSFNDGCIKKAESVETIYISDFLKNQTMTKSSQYENEALAYVVNFENSDGYAILSSNANSNPIIAYVENGSFSVEDYIRYITSSDNDALVSDTASFQQLQYDLVTASIIAPPDINIPLGQRYITNMRDTSEVVKCFPLVPTKWDQNRPYNVYCPMYNGNLSLAGCVPVACAQALLSLVYHKNFRPTSQICNSYPVDYNVIMEAIDADTVKYSPSSNTPSSRNVAALIRSIGWSIGASYSDMATSADPSLFIETLSSIGYTNVFSILAADMTKQMFFDMLVSKNNPIITTAYRVTNASTSGHCFLVDGFLRLEYKYDLCYNVPTGVVVEDSFRTSFDLVHVNFGWGGISDGYYSPTSFNLSDERFREWAEENDIPYSMNRNYDRNISYILLLD